MHKFLTRHIRPLSILAFTVGCFLAAQGTGIQLFLHLFYILLFMLIFSYLWAWSNLRGLTIQREALTHRAHVGEYARERLIIRNRWFLPRLWIEFQDHSDLPQHGIGFVASLGSKQRYRWTARTCCTRRGRFTLGPATLISGDPFGIFRTERRLPNVNEIIVYPPLIALARFDLPGTRMSGGRTMHQHTHHITPNVFSVREYAPGDSFNRIHWRTTARTGQLMVKEFELEPAADCYIVLDMYADSVVTDTRGLHTAHSPYNLAVESTEEYAILAAASLARHLLDQKRAVGLITWELHVQILSAERETRQMFKILEMLAVLQARGNRPLADMLMGESPRFGHNTTLLIITASCDERWPQALQHLLARGVRATILFIDPQSFGGLHDPAPVLAHIAELHVFAYRWYQGQSLNDALDTPLLAPGRRFDSG